MLSTASLIKKRFTDASGTYRDYAVVQKQMAEELSKELLECVNSSASLVNKRLRVLEIGCGTGFLTEKIKNYFNVQQYIANDICPDMLHYAESIIAPHVDEFSFISGDAKKIYLTNSADIIVGNAVIQWIDDLEEMFSNLHKYSSAGSVLAFSSFAQGHYFEIQSITGKGLIYPSVEIIHKKAQPFFDVIMHKKNSITLYFDSPLAVLRHMKKTGVNSVATTIWQKRHIKEFTNAYEQFKTEQGYSLTYCPLYILLKKTEKTS